MFKIWKSIWNIISKIKPLRVILILFTLLLILDFLNPFINYILYDLELYVFFILAGFTLFSGIVGIINYIWQDVLKKPKV